MHIDDLLVHMEVRDASDLYLKAGQPPLLRVSGEIVPIDGQILSDETIRRLAEQIMGPRHRHDFQHRQRADVAYSSSAAGRFRVNVYVQRGSAALVARRVKSHIPTFEELRLPSVVAQLALAPRGLVLVVGQTGAGKSTTLAAMIRYRSQQRSGHIVTIEDPIEFIYPDDKSIVSQREVGTDCESYSLALRDAVRQAPDVILIGEMRDEESATAAVHFAETGHLVLSTLHSSTASQALERLFHFFPAGAHQALAMQLSLNLNGIISQRLIPRKDGNGRVVAAEVLLATPRVRELLRKMDLPGIRAVMQSPAGSQEGMQTFDQAVFHLIKDGLIDVEAGMAAAESPNDLRLRLKGLL
ncbi:MAG: PilT/PilU family type 4a pilus ATPase [Armatimonadota bacterium]|nr:PilT/PilU family type 4a pilus ATPase [Armatimonadota bacterium]